MAEQSLWLRIAEIIVGLIILILAGYAIAYPGVAAATLIGFLAVGLIVLSGIEFAQVFALDISGWRRLLNLILSAIAFLLALAGTRVPANLGWTDPRVAGSTGVDLRGIRGHRTRHSGDDNRRDHRSCSRFCRAGISPARRRHCSTLASDSSDRLRVNVDSIGHLGKMGVTHPPFFFSCNERVRQKRRFPEACTASSSHKTAKKQFCLITYVVNDEPSISLKKSWLKYFPESEYRPGVNVSSRICDMSFRRQMHA